MTGKLAERLALGRGGIWDQVARGRAQESAISRPPVPAVAGVVTGDALAAVKAAERKAFEAVQAWLAGLGVRLDATTLDALLQQAAPLLQRVAAPSVATNGPVATPVATPPVDAATTGKAASSERARLWRLDHPEEYAAAKARSAAKRKAKAVG